MGWRDRAGATKEILWGHWWYRVAFIAWALVSGYDTFSGVISQIIPKYELIPLGTLVMGGSHLLPWWGWLLVLQGLLWASIVEYLTRHAPGLKAAGRLTEPRPPLTLPAQPLPAPNPRPMSSPPTGLTPAQLDHARKIAESLVAANRRKIIQDWSRNSSYELYQAASLWAEALPPRVSIMPLTEGATAKLAMLKSAIRRGELEATLDDAATFLRSGPTDTTWVTRDALIAYAAKMGDRPAFLFPEA